VNVTGERGGSGTKDWSIALNDGRICGTETRIHCHSICSFAPFVPNVRQLYGSNHFCHSFSSRFFTLLTMINRLYFLIIGKVIIVLIKAKKGYALQTRILFGMSFEHTAQIIWEIIFMLASRTSLENCRQVLRALLGTKTCFDV
jgi:hypothetical protein